MSRAERKTCVLLCTLVLATVVSAAILAKEEPDRVALQIGDRAPGFVLKTLNPELCGMELLSSRRLFGSAEETADAPLAVVLSFGANSCKPCIRELPALQALHDRLGERGLAVVFINIDSEREEIDAMLARIREQKLTIPVLSDRFTILAMRYGASELPFLLLVAPDGRIRWVRKGYGKSVISNLEAVLRSMLPEKAGDPPGPQETQ